MITDLLIQNRPKKKKIGDLIHYSPYYLVRLSLRNYMCGNPHNFIILLLILLRYDSESPEKCCSY